MSDTPRRTAAIKFFQKCSRHMFNTNQQWMMFDLCDVRHPRLHRSELTKQQQFFMFFIWCVFVSGFRMNTVAKMWPHVADFTDDFNHAAIASLDEETFFEYATKIFGNRSKWLSVRLCARKMLELEWDQFEQYYIKDEHVDHLRGIGPIAKEHLLRNFGSSRIKPDRWLVRLADVFKYPDPQTMCKDVADATGVDHRAVDIAMFKYCADYQQSGFAVAVTYSKIRWEEEQLRKEA